MTDRNQGPSTATKAARAALSTSEQLLAVVIALALALIVVAVSGFNVGDVASALISGFTDNPLSMLRWATPLTLTGLAAAVAFRGKVWNIGFDGQLYMGAAAAVRALWAR